MAFEVLIVDDEPGIRETLIDILEMEHYACEAVADGSSALERLRGKAFHCVLLDINLPDMSGLDLLREVQRLHPASSVIMITGHASLDNAIRSLNDGAYAYLTKPVNMAEVNSLLRRVREKERLLEERQALQRELQRLAVTDDLTGLYNQRHFFNQLLQEVERAKRQSHPLSIILVDLDQFKQYNDSRGHPAGDVLLKQAGGLLSKSIRQHVDSAYRYGGDEFAILLPDTAISQAIPIAERVERAFRKECSPLTISVGLANLQPGWNGDTLVHRADEALYQAKRLGGGRVEVYVEADGERVKDQVKGA